MYFKLVNSEGKTFNRLIANNPKQAVEIATMIEPNTDKDFTIVQINHDQFHSMVKVDNKWTDRECSLCGEKY